MDVGRTETAGFSQYRDCRLLRWRVAAARPLWRLRAGRARGDHAPLPDRRTRRGGRSRERNPRAFADLIWRRPIDARLLLGWIVCAFFGAALTIRPVGWIIGPRRTGKSTLQEAINHLLGGWLISVLDPTFAAIRQTLKYDCLAVAIDEAESDEDQNSKRRLNDLVKLARLCFSGGKSPRGGSDGEATEYMLRSSVLFSSINRPALLSQDRSRMWLGRLGKLPPDYPAPPDLSPRRLRSLGARLLRRAIDGWPRLATAREQYRIALKAVGHEGRSTEVFATLLAAADIVLSDYPVDSDSAAEIAGELPFATLLEAEEDLSEEQGWLQWLLSCVIPLDGPGPRNTVAAWLRQSVKSTSLYDRQEADRILGQYGPKVIRPKGATTRWAGQAGTTGPWKAAAGELEGGERAEQRFGDWRGKGTAIPLKLAFPDGYAEGPVAHPAELHLEDQ